MEAKGRNAKYAEWLTEDGLLTIKGWARDGLSNKQIAQNLGISHQTMAVWLNRFDQFSKAIKDGRAPVLVKIEDAFYSRCDWTKVEEIEEEYTVDEEGNLYHGRKHIKKTTKWIPPSDAILIFALKNLKPEKYKDKPVPKQEEQKEDDGLMKALNKTSDKLFSTGDDSAMVSENEGS